MRTAYRTCPLCDAVCDLRLTLDHADRITSAPADPDDPFFRGYACPKGANRGRLDEDLDRPHRLARAQTGADIAGLRTRSAPGTRLIGRRQLPSNANTFTDDSVIDLLPGIAVSNGVPVTAAPARPA
ncbi:hypothetical protein [Micromonospora sp. NPDC007230]|uniref:hypothetical protein n=1 Tax=Micromonospora sp. NPDC007230 TaxID=3364237 RepID=UPI0036D0B4DF